jgi:hypothetical protein
MDIKTPQNSINAFLIDEVNIEIYENLRGMGMSMEREFESEVNILDFFNMLFSEFEFFIKNVNDYVKIREHFVDHSPLFYEENFEDETQFYTIKFILYGMLILLLKAHYPKNERKGIVNSSFKWIKKLDENFHKAINKDNNWTPPVETEVNNKQSKSLLFNSKSLNIQERYNIAVKVLDIEKKIIQLSDTTKEQKNQLLAYILGCNIDNAKKLLNGGYDAKPRDLSKYFMDLGINK